MNESHSKSLLLTKEAVLQGYDAVSGLYPHVPSLSHWRAWEYAAYQNFRLEGRILDLGCGDGRYFKLIWPEAGNVTGVDLDPAVAELARQGGVYERIYLAHAHQVPEPDACFDHVFANCSLEHMDNLDLVLAEIHRLLAPGGTLLCSVVTDRFIQWSLLPKFIAMAGYREAAAMFHRDFIDYHHLANPLPVDEWKRQFDRAGLDVEVHIPILPLNNSGIFLLMDGLWHIKRGSGGELGEVIYPFLSANAKFPKGFRKVFEGLLDMESDWLDCSGAVFLVRKAR